MGILSVPGVRSESASRAVRLAWVVAVLAVGLLTVPQTVWSEMRPLVLADFEQGSAPLQSYDGEDFDPNDWEIQSENTYGGSEYALRLWGNTWKELAITPCPVSVGTVFEGAIYCERLSELQAIGFADDADNVLFYCVAGSQLSLSDRWNVVYQGAFPRGEWHAYRMPIGQDWQDTWGTLPVITHIIFVNDRDQSFEGATVFDEIYDITDQLPIAPTVQIQKIVGVTEAVAPDPTDSAGEQLYRVDVQFQGLVYDPDSPTHTYRWDFGDGTTSTEPDPAHSFTSHADYTFTVSLDCADETGLFGRDTCQVVVEPEGQDGGGSINIAGDIFMGRGYDQPGGLIDTYGVEYLWEPTRGILGDAADISVVNAECPFTDRGEPHPTKEVVFRTRPENVAGLVYAGVDVVSTGNNHIIDYGLEGLEQTLAVFDTAGIVNGGAGINSYFGLQPCYYTYNGVRLAFVNQCNRTGRDYNYQPFLDAGYDKCGFGYWLEPNIDRALAQADSLADIVIAMPHSGLEYYTSPPRGDGSDALPPDVENCPPYVPFAEARDVEFRIWPGLSDRELRYHAVDQGADAVINGHPHVLQGFEVYQGVLIAHSLGNFMFDLYYPETMPTIVLRARFDKEGILGYSFKPAFIDQWIPRPASGRLGREILDRMADYSRVLGALVGVDPEVMAGTIYLDPLSASELVAESTGTQGFYSDEGQYLSLPIALAGQGSLSAILDVTGVDPGSCEIRVGREVLWFGRFEQDEGYHMWNLNSDAEWIDDAVYYEGGHALAQRRTHGDETDVTTFLDRHLPAADSLCYGLNGWIKTENAVGARLSLRFYDSRYNWNQMATLHAVESVDGTTDWTWYARDFPAQEGGKYFNVRCRLDVPPTGDAYAWFDDLRVIEWQPWQPLSLPLEIPYPNNMRFVQVRTPDPAQSVSVRYAETALTNGGFSAVEEQPRPREVGVLLAGASPNPFAKGTTLRYRLGASARVSLEIFDVSGRCVAQLAHGAWQRPGWHRVPWDARGLTAGLYFARLTVDGEAYSRRMVLVH